MNSDQLNYAVMEWLANGETGLSSKTIAFTAVGILFESSSHPWDPADFRRCHELMERIPELRRHLDKVRAVSPEWNALIERWDEIEKVYIRESTFGNRAPDTYALMKEIIDGVRHAEHANT